VRRTAAWIAVLAFLFTNGSASGNWGHMKGQPGFSFEVVPTVSHIVGSPDVRLIVRAYSAGCRKDDTGIVRFVIPAGTFIKEGEQFRTVHTSGCWSGPPDCEYQVVLRVSGQGDLPIRTQFKFLTADPGVWDEQDGMLAMLVSGDTITLGQYRPLRTERINHGKRFRYGGEHMVAIDGPDDPGEGAIESKPEAIAQAKGSCVGCGRGRAVEVVRMAVTVGPDGQVRWVEPSSPGASAMDPRVWDAATTAVKQWRFRPSMTVRGRPTADWAVVDVVVETPAE